MRIAVVGAGLGGVAVAVGLHRAGHEVTLYERAPELREAGTAIAITPNGVRALDELGLAGYVRGRAVTAANGGLRDWRGRPLLVTDVDRAQRTAGTMSVVGRAELHRALRAPLPPALVRTATPIHDLDQSAEEVTLRAAPGRESKSGADIGAAGHVEQAAEADIGRDRATRGGGHAVAVDRVDAVVVADGIGSGLRGRVVPGHPGPRRTGRVDLRGVLATPAGLDVGGLVAGILVDRRTGAMFGLFSLGGGLLYWFTDAALRGAPPEPDEARRRMAALLDDWHPAVPALIAATAPEDIYVDAIACLAEPLPTYAAGRIALLGDAAHAMPPDLGQGSAQAFEDAAVLTRHLTGAAPGDVPDRLRRYDAERRPRANRMIGQALRQSRVMTRTGAPAWLRDTALRAVPGGLATRILATIWQI